MALLRASGLFRLALRTPWASLRLLSAAAAGGESSAGEDTPGRRVDLEALRRERALRPPSERVPPAPPRKVNSTPKPSREQLQLNKAVTDADDVDDVLALVASRWAIVNGVTLSTALSVIARLAGKREPALWLKDDKRFRLLLRGALSLMERQELGARSFSNMLYACGQLGIAPPKSWLLVYWKRSAAVIDDFNPQELSNMIYACGQLSVSPPEDWLGCFWRASAEKLDDFIPQNLSNTIYACGVLAIKPPADWLERYWLVSALKFDDFVPQALSNSLYACGQLCLLPPADWLERFWHASAMKLGDFNPQNLSNTVYALMQLGITPPADWLERYWHATALKLGEFMPQNLGNTLYACGQLGTVPPADWLERFWHASASKLGDFKPQELCNTLLACGLLDTRPTADWLQRFSSVCEQAVPGMNDQGLANTAVALTMLGLWELPLWRGLWERICALPRNIAGWRADDRLGARQMYQTYQTAAVERPGLLPAPSSELLAAARESWIAQVRDGGDNVRAGRLHDAVSDCLTRMGVPHANEHWCDRAERSIDIAIEGAAPIALEVDGPSHFLQDGRPDGRTMLRNRMLVAYGWRVVVVDYRAWDGLTDDAQQEAYLRRLLA
jgi:hypothetical protein